MPTEVILPRVDMDMTEGMIAAWHVNEGDEVREGTLIFEIETSKATMEIDAPASGVIRQISAPVGKTVPVGTAVAWIYASGEALQEQAATAPSAQSAQHEAAPSSPSARSVQPETACDEASSHTGAAIADPESGGQAPQPLRATPAARRVARERGLRLASVAGSGPNGRIGEQDVLRAHTDAVRTASGPLPAADRLHAVWLRKGPAAPLVMLHGFAAESNSWRPFTHALDRAAEANVGMLGIDLPCHGKSSQVAASSIGDIVAAIERTLAAEGVDEFHLVGHSLGGAVALATAAALPRGGVRSLTLLAPAGLGAECNGAFITGITRAARRASLVAWLRQLFADPSRLDDAFIATAEQQLASAEVRERLASLAEIFFPDGVQSLDLRGALDRIDMPARVVWGLQDRIIPARHAEGLPGRIGVHRFAQAGHLPQMEAQQEVAMIVAENMRSAQPGSSRPQAAVG
ncbi:acetoin dehydrogenase dihydrolipoyllysine-residue acetyltransferase subunit [Paraburkholderia sp. PREW-6R]|uniref:acetoin dehydrogenase dihydrolipoyllysine-residue acetyltransferase subunit n=1 Tax=Paraburkholderia sp. PREW-6R TaxID=3141544 RepID=UPI0031F52448